jgi:signal transduction histidine kinase/CheY-like chemotaxis protein/HAMP domain-containing protein
MIQGKIHMDNARRIVQNMVNIEQDILRVRTTRMNEFAGITPTIILLAAAMSIVITIVSYLRARNDFEKRAQLYAELLNQERETTNRILLIEGLADKISKGDYEIRIEDKEEKDSLGSLALSLNKMAESLKESFGTLSNKEWLQTGIAGLNETMVGEKNIEGLTSDILQYIVNYTGSQVGAFYLTNETTEYLSLCSGYALSREKNDKIALGEGLVGQSALTQKEIVLSNLEDGNITISYASGEAKPGNIFVLPILHENILCGVIEVASIKPYSNLEKEYIRSVAYSIGIAVNSAQSRHKMQQLLEETQTQSEELQTQHSELENLNTELEAQAQKLQASEEELKVQQEELLEANIELEERSKNLAEKNQLIVERNLEIQSKAEQLELSTKYKSEFLANMSHELRTPLNSILLLSRLMYENTEQNLTEEQIEYAKVIQSSGNGLLALIDEILDLSKIEAGKMDLEFAETSIKDIVSDMKSLFTPIARQKNLDFTFETATDAPVTIVTDKLRLEQVLKNLLSNALKFTYEGSVNVSINHPGNKSLITFSVKDTGIGIPADKQQHVFEAFQQADGSTRRKFGGTGLGLSISRELTRLLGGEITLISEPDKGSEFIVTLPVSPNVTELQERKDLVSEPAARHAAPGPSPIAEEPKPQRFVVDSIPPPIPDDRDEIVGDTRPVLIIEDDTNFAKALLEFTHKNGYKGIVAVRGDQGIEMAQKYNPIAILLDIHLPIKDGWEVMEQLKSNLATKHIPVHIMSSVEAKRESITKGAVDFINKPVAIDQMKVMFSKLEDALNRNPKKVLIIEENAKHAQALSSYLASFNVNSEIRGSVAESVSALQNGIDCVILDMGIPGQNGYETLEAVKKNKGLENLPIIIFTGKNLSKEEEAKLKQYADSIVLKTAHSYQRILDEVALFLHLIQEKHASDNGVKKNMPGLNEVLKNQTVLIADDDVRNIFSLTKALEQVKMKVLSATDGKEALRLLDENPETDVVLMDMMMPEMDGYESITRIRKNLKYKNLPILAVTAKAMVGDREKCIKAGASDYISKPVDIDQLISLLRVWLYDKQF